MERAWSWPGRWSWGCRAAGCSPGQNAGHTYANPAENELTAANVADLDELWSVPVGGEVTAPIVSGDRLYLARSESATQSGLVGAFDTATGATEWSETLVTGTSGTRSIDVLAPTEADGQLWTGYSLTEDERLSTRCRAERVRLDTGTGALTDSEDGFGSSAVSSGDDVIQRPWPGATSTPSSPMGRPVSSRSTPPRVAVRPTAHRSGRLYAVAGGTLTAFAPA